MNFIKHFLTWMELAADDHRMEVYHMCLYNALFVQWNMNRFRNPISISRDETRRMARIGSKNKYHQCLRDLHDWGYIKYMPTKDIMIGSKVTMNTFFDVVKDVSGTTPGTTRRPSVIPSIKIITNKIQTVTKREGPPTLDEVMDFFVVIKASETEALKFFNYYEANGWRQGGRSKLKNWEAAARRWMLGADNFISPKNKDQNGNSTATKNYSESL